MPKAKLSADRLCAVLADRLRDVCPPEIDLEVEDGRVLFVGTGGAYDVKHDVEHLPGSNVDVVRRVAFAALDYFQDAVSETLTLPWPDRTNASPGVDVIKGICTLWYGAREAPVLELRDFAVSSVEAS